MSEIEKVLKLLEEGKISADEALRLIEAIKEKKEKESVRDEERFDFLDIGKVVSDAIRTTFSVVPNAIRMGFSQRRIDEVIEDVGLENLRVDISAGDVELETREGTRRIEIRGSGNFNFNDGTLTLMGDLEVTLPEFRELTIKAKAGDIDVDIKGERINVELEAGDGDFELDADELKVSAKMGDLDVYLKRAPKEAEIRCGMGDLEVKLPEKLDGIVETSTTFGSLYVARSDFKREDDKYIFGSGKGSLIKIHTKMGNATVK